METLAPTILLDFSRSIKEQIEWEVLKLKNDIRVKVRDLRNEGWAATYDGPLEPTEVRLGYLVNMHRGKDLFQEGDTIAGLSVKIDRFYQRAITMSCEEMRLRERSRAFIGEEAESEAPDAEYRRRTVTASTSW